MIHEVNRLSEGGESDEVRQERYQYIAELTDKINQYNNVLTEWIQMRQGSLSLRIESFRLQQLFDIVSKGKMSFQMQGVKLEVEPTDAVVKADRILTLFMINTIADNARKFTPEGGKVTISAKVSDFVEISISDTGKGMDEEQLAHVFDRTYTGGHGFGLLNCKGIIEKYKKVSSLFAGCQIKAESKLGEGSRFSFRLPKGIARRAHQLLGIIIMLFVLLSASVQPCEAKKANDIRQRHNHHKTNVDVNLQRADDLQIAPTSAISTAPTSAPWPLPILRAIISTRSICRNIPTASISWWLIRRWEWRQNSPGYAPDCQPIIKSSWT